MSEADKYTGVDWIRVDREEPVILEGQRYVSETHHIAETEFLIAEIRRLAARIDKLNAALRRYRKQADQQRQRSRRQAQLDADYLPYEEDDRR